MTSQDQRLRGPARALLVVDETVLADVVQLALNHGQYTTRVVRTVEEAAEMLADWRPHLVVLDLDCEGSRMLESLEHPNSAEPTCGRRVRATMLEAHRRLSDSTTVIPGCLPLFVGRNPFALLDAEVLTDSDAINRALSPYWSSLWTLAARGHYAVAQRPIRMPMALLDGLSLVPIPSITHGPFTLSFARGDGHDLSFLLEDRFDSPRGRGGTREPSAVWDRGDKQNAKLTSREQIVSRPRSLGPVVLAKQ